MADYVITTDSNSDVLPEFIKENDLTIIPQYYSFGDTVYGDELNMPPHEFYETMRKGELPKSQANNPAVIRDKFEKILKEGKNILHIAFSSALSGSCNNVVMTANELLEDYPDRKIMVFDSLNASLGEGVSVYRAVELWKEGKSMEEVYDVLMKERDHVNVSFTVKSSAARRSCVQDDCSCGKPCEYQANPDSNVYRRVEVRRNSQRTQKISQDAGIKNGGVAGPGFLWKGQNSSSPSRRLYRGCKSCG